LLAADKSFLVERVRRLPPLQMQDVDARLGFVLSV
jgi:hypothetical protein